jgi:hypothetical protein
MSVSTQDESFIRNMDPLNGPPPPHNKRGGKNDMNPHYDHRMSRNEHRRINHNHNNPPPFDIPPNKLVDGKRTGNPIEMMSPLVSNIPSMTSTSNIDSRKYNEYEKDYYEKTSKKKKKKKGKNKIPPSPGLEKMQSQGNMDNIPSMNSMSKNGNYYNERSRDRNDYGGYNNNNNYNKKMNQQQFMNDFGGSQNFKQKNKNMGQSNNGGHPNHVYNNNNDRIINTSRIKRIESPYSNYEGGRALNSHHILMEYHEAHKLAWKINDAFFDKPSNYEYEPYYSYEEAKDLIAKDRAFRGTISFIDGMNFTAIIQSGDFVKKVYAKGYNINRATDGCEVIFCPVSENWEQYMVINQTEDIKNIAVIEKAELDSEELLHYNEMKKKSSNKNNFSEEVVDPELQK